MADVRLTPQNLSDVAQDTTRTAIATGNVYQVRIPPGGVMLNFRKTGAGAATVTLTTPQTVQGLAVADRALTVDATTGDEILLIKNKVLYGNSDGDVEFATSEGTGLTCAVGQGFG